jgi:carboxypeptidase T
VASGSADAFDYGRLGVVAFTFEMESAFLEGCSTEHADPLICFKAARRPYQL